jgi:hypothetical protein
MGLPLLSPSFSLYFHSAQLGRVSLLCIFLVLITPVATNTNFLLQKPEDAALFLQQYECYVLSGLYFFEHANVKAEKVQRSKVIYTSFLLNLTLQIHEQF